MAPSVASNLYFEIERQLHEIGRQLRQNGGYPYDSHQLRTALQAVIEGKFVATTIDFFPVSVDYTRSVEEMVRVGEYNWSNPDINRKNFPLQIRGKIEVKVGLIRFNRYVASDEVLRELDKQGLRAATLPELLSLGEQHPGLQRQFPVVALGSVWHRRCEDRRVACLWGHSDCRKLGLDWLESRWYGFGFAAVHK
jgi:hypothetical protein